MSSDEKRERIDKETTKQGGDYLFSKQGMSDSEYMDMRTRIRSDSMSEYLLYLSILGNTYGSTVARNVKDTTERLLISSLDKNDINGRSEAVAVLRQNFPKRIEIEKGFDEE